MEIYSCKVVFVVLVALLIATGSLSQLPECGQAPLHDKIIGGENAPRGFWPWQVSIQNKSRKPFCGGTLITELYVLSAAHCFQSVTANDITIYLGIQSLNETADNVQIKNATKITVPKNYNEGTFENDIALVELNSPVNVTDFVSPVCLAAIYSSLPADTEVWVTGFGQVSSEMNSSSETMQQVKVKIVSNSYCKIPYYMSSITNKMICAGQEGKDACHGDSGGPLVLKQNQTWVQGGIVSHGNGCGSKYYPGVYTRVSEYEEWINNNTNGNKPKFVTVSFGNQGSPNISCLLFSFSIIPFYFFLSVF